MDARAVEGPQHSMARAIRALLAKRSGLFLRIIPRAFAHKLPRLCTAFRNRSDAACADQLFRQPLQLRINLHAAYAMPGLEAKLGNFL